MAKKKAAKPTWLGRIALRLAKEVETQLARYACAQDEFDGFRELLNDDNEMVEQLCRESVALEELEGDLRKTTLKLKRAAEDFRKRIAPFTGLRAALAAPAEKKPAAKPAATKLTKSTKKKPAAKKKSTSTRPAPRSSLTKSSKSAPASAAAAAPKKKNGTARRRKAARSKKEVSAGVAKRLGLAGAEGESKRLDLVCPTFAGGVTVERVLAEGPASSTTMGLRLGLSRDAAGAQLRRRVRQGSVRKAGELYELVPAETMNGKKLVEMTPAELARSIEDAQIRGALNLADDDGADDEEEESELVRSTAEAGGGTATLAKRGLMKANPARTKPLFGKGKPK